MPNPASINPGYWTAAVFIAPARIGTTWMVSLERYLSANNSKNYFGINLPVIMCIACPMLARN